LDEPREVQVVILNPRFLVVADGDVLARCHTPSYTRYVSKCFDCVGLWAERRTCKQLVRRCISSLLAPLGRSLREGA
jgi:hypothetical protein